MPIDYEDLSQTADADLASLLQKQHAGIPGDVSQIGTAIGQHRQNFFKDAVNPLLEGTIASIGGDPGAYLGGAQGSANRVQSGLERDLQSRLAGTRLNASQTNLGRQVDNQTRLQQQARSLNLNNQDYATQTSNLKQSQDFQEQQAAISRELANQMSQIQDEYTQRGLALQQEYSGQNDYQSALNRALFGLVGAGAAGAGIWAMNRPKVPQATYRPDQLNPVNTDVYSGGSPVPFYQQGGPVDYGQR